VLVPSLAALAAVTAVLGLASTPTPFMIAMAALGVASGYAGVPPAPMLSDVTPDELKGTAVAAFRFVGDLGFVLGPLVAGLGRRLVRVRPSFLINAAPTLLALALVLSIRETMPSMRVRREAGL